jgi:hypothetical protein
LHLSFNQTHFCATNPKCLTTSRINKHTSLMSHCCRHCITFKPLLAVSQLPSTCFWCTLFYVIPQKALGRTSSKESNLLFTRFSHIIMSSTCGIIIDLVVTGAKLDPLLPYVLIVTRGYTNYFDYFGPVRIGSFATFFAEMRRVRCLLLRQYYTLRIRFTFVFNSCNVRLQILADLSKPPFQYGCEHAELLSLLLCLLGGYKSAYYCTSQFTHHTKQTNQRRVPTN